MGSCGIVGLNCQGAAEGSYIERIYHNGHCARCRGGECAAAGIGLSEVGIGDGNALKCEWGGPGVGERDCLWNACRGEG